MSRDFCPMEKYLSNKELKDAYRKDTITWIIDGKEYPRTYEDSLSDIEKKYIKDYPELIFLAPGMLDVLKKSGVTDDFIKKVENIIIEIENAYDNAINLCIQNNTKELKPIIPDKDEELHRLTLNFWTNTPYNQASNIEHFSDELIQVFDIEKRAKDCVRDYLENDYDTISEIY